jgi:SecD/SecF fusion protein
VLFAEGKGRDIAEVRKAVEELPDVAVSSVGENNREFKVDTSEGDIQKVQQALSATFGDALQTYGMKFDELATIEAPKEEPRPQSETGQPKPDEPRQTTAPADARPADEAQTPPAPAEPKPAEPAAKPQEPADKPAETPDAPKAEQPPTADGPKSSLRDRPTSAKFRLASLAVSPALTTLAVAQDNPPPAATEAEEQKDAKTETPPADTPAPSAGPTPAAATTPPEATGQPAAETKAQTPAADTADQPAAADAQAPESPAAEAAPADSLVGGTRVELTFPQTISYEPLAEMIDKQLAEMKLTGVAYLLKSPKYQPGSDAAYANWTLQIGLDQAQTRTLLEAIQKRLAATPVFPSSNQIGGKVAGDTQLMALYAILASLVMIVIYIWVRFQNVVFGLAGVVALVHDVLMAVAFLAMSYYLAPYLGFLMVDPFKISLTVVAALLTIVGYSINDKIVIFDRVREVRGKSVELSEALINTSLNQTLSRTILTGGAVLASTLILYFVGGPGIHAFAFTMFVGIVAGTYSSVYIAAPLLLWLKRPSASGQQAARAARALGAGSRQAPARGI